MRKLTISREKCTIGALSSVKIYIEDHILPELYINGVPCRKIGAVKNGETVSFNITTKEVKIFAIGKKSSRHYANDCYQLLGGYDEVFLSGKKVFNLFSQNPFKFNDNHNPQADALRIKAGRKATLIYLAVLLACLMILTPILGGAFNSWVDYDRDIYSEESWRDDAPDKVFTVDDFNIVLNDNFVETKGQGFAGILDSEKVSVFLVRENFDKYPEFKDLTIEEYGTKVIEANGFKDTSVQFENDLHFFVFKSVSSKSGEEYTYYGYLFKTEHAFWFIHFAVRSVEIDQYRDDIQKWASTIEFK